MREGRPSLTAIMVAFARGVAAREPALSALCPDLLATELLPRRVARLLEGSAGRARNQGLMLMLRGLALGLIDHLAFRTAIIDEALRAALAEGIDQIVLLGAGLDARAHRIEAARDAVVFEVDHPSTQAYKRRRAQGLPLFARELRYAACDFEQVSLAQSLASVGFDSARRSVWIWEGVTMYLPEPAVMATLDAITGMTVQGSTLIASYVTPELTSLGPRLGRMGAALLSAISEPLRSSFQPHALAQALSARRLQVMSDALPLTAAERLGVARAPFAKLVPNERILVAKRIDA